MGSSTTSAPIRRAIARRVRIAVDADDQRRAHQLRARGRAQADRALGEDDDRVADANLARLGAGEAGRRDVGQQHDLLVGQRLGDLGQVGLRVRDEQVLGLRAVDRVAEAPAADGLVAGAVAALAQLAAEAGVALAARRDGADEHAVADLVAGDAGAELLDDPDGLVADDRAPARTGYSPLRMWTSVPQIVVSVTRMSASPGPGRRPRHLFDADVARAMEDGRAHRSGSGTSRVRGGDGGDHLRYLHGSDCSSPPVRCFGAAEPAVASSAQPRCVP